MEKSYGKRPLWQWIAIYVAVGAVVYGLIYYFVFAGKGGGSALYPSNTPQPTSASTEAQTVPSSQSPEMTVKLNEENNSKESGQAIIKEDNGKTTVTLSLTGFAQGIPQPAHIHIGSCPGVAAVKYPLTNVLNGSSTTVLDVTLAEMKQNLPLAINVHKSAQEITNYTACGQLSSK